MLCIEESQRTNNDKTNDGHSISQHEDWVELMDCAVIKINGDLTNEER